MHSIDLRMSACVTVRDRNRDEKGTEGWTEVHERSYYMIFSYFCWFCLKKKRPDYI